MLNAKRQENGKLTTDSEIIQKSERELNGIVIELLSLQLS